MNAATRTPRDEAPPRTYAAFVGPTRVAQGDLRTVLHHLKERADRGATDGLLLFEDDTGRQLDVDLRGTLTEVLARALPESPPPGRGRPRLGVTAREVTLLPRHWEWLERQPQGASATLRRLVDDARRRAGDDDDKRRAREAAHRFMTTMAGDRPGYEEALRALYAGDRDAFERRIAPWPTDIRGHARTLAAPSFTAE